MMRATQRCATCSGGRFAVNILRNLNRGSLPAVPAIVIENRKWSQVEEWHGYFETWICLACGRSEFFARDYGEIEALARKHPDQVRIVEVEPREQGPYR